MGAQEKCKAADGIGARISACGPRCLALWIRVSGVYLYSCSRLSRIDGPSCVLRSAHVASGNAESERKRNQICPYGNGNVKNNDPGKPANKSVLYAEGEYASLLHRFAIVIIDGAVIVLVWIILASMSRGTFDHFGRINQTLVLSCFAFAYMYLAILKPSRLRTLGYRIVGVRIVDHSGKPPSIVRMTFRVLLWSLGPFNPVVDLLWLGGDRHRQTLRDKIAGTYVITHDASPIGRGNRKAAYYNLMGATLVLWEIHSDE